MKGFPPIFASWRTRIMLRELPHHPSLHLKQIGRYWSVRVGARYRALGIDADGDVVWFWIGTHAEYDRLLKSK